MIQYLFNNLGGQSTSKGVGNLLLKVIKRIIETFEEKARVQFFDYLISILTDDKNDKGISILTSCFYKDQCEKCPSSFLPHAKEILTLTLEQSPGSDAFILDYTERMIASLNLYIYLIGKEKQLAQTHADLLQQWWGEGVTA